MTTKKRKLFLLSSFHSPGCQLAFLSLQIRMASPFTLFLPCIFLSLLFIKKPACYLFFFNSKWPAPNSQLLSFIFFCNSQTFNREWPTTPSLLLLLFIGLEERSFTPLPTGMEQLEDKAVSCSVCMGKRKKMSWRCRRELQVPCCVLE